MEVAVDVPGNGNTFGGKTIGVFGSVAMLLNNILGPGIANFPAAFQRAGWFAPSALIFICVVSSLCSGEMLVMAIRAMPGNDRFEKRVEYSTLCRHYFSLRAATCTVVVFLLAMISANISNIIQTAHVVDATIDGIFSDSCALELYPSFFRFFCHSEPDDVTPFGTGKVLLSLGTAICAALSLPLSFINLDDNIVFQNISLVFIVLSIGVWLWIFLVLGLEPSRVPLLRTDDGLSAFKGVSGIILFNFMFISTLPSWICEKRPDIVAVRMVFWTLVLAVVGFVSVGAWGGMAFTPYYETDNTLLSELHHIHRSASMNFAIGLSVDAYAISANLASIPIFSIMVRYNLVELELMGPRAAGFLSVALPWVISVLLYCGSGFTDVVDFAGTFTSSVVNLIVPSLLFVASQRSRPQPSGEGDAHMCGQMLSSDVSDAVARDRSGHIRSARHRRIWLSLAWVNVAVMTLLTVLAIADQLADGGP